MVKYKKIKFVKIREKVHSKCEKVHSKCEKVHSNCVKVHLLNLFVKKKTRLIMFYNIKLIVNILWNVLKILKREYFNKF